MKNTIFVGCAIAATAFAFVACSSTSNPSGFGPGGDGDGDKDGSTGGGGVDGNQFSMNDAGMMTMSNGDGGACSANLTARVRDFVNKPGFTPATALDDDFQNAEGDDRGIVATDLGADLKPVYAHPNGMTSTTHGKTQFDWWYRDTAGKNIAIDYPVVLSPVAGMPNVQTFNKQSFFPVDGQGWKDNYQADDGNQHNFSFTFELHTTFGYTGGEIFTFIGDDDVFVFINHKLVVDLGGVHGAETKSVHLDTLVTDDAAKTAVPLTTGTTYALDIFENERHTTASHFRMDTTIVFNNCDAIIVK